MSCSSRRSRRPAPSPQHPGRGAASRRVGQNGAVTVAAKADYAVRAMIELAGGTEESPVTAERIAVDQEIPLRFLDTILTELRYAGFVQGRTGAEGGYWLARAPEEVTLADIIREVDGPLGSVHGKPPDELTFLGNAQPLQEVWIALRANMREVLESVTIADLLTGQLPEPIGRIVSDPDVWQPRPR
jgi:Rrf2 family protein